MLTELLEKIINLKRPVLLRSPRYGEVFAVEEGDNGEQKVRQVQYTPAPVPVERAVSRSAFNLSSFHILCTSGGPEFGRMPITRVEYSDAGNGARVTGVHRDSKKGGIHQDKVVLDVVASQALNDWVMFLNGAKRVSHAVLADFIMSHQEDLSSPELARAVAMFRTVRTVTQDLDGDTGEMVGIKVEFTGKSQARGTHASLTLPRLAHARVAPWGNVPTPDVEVPFLLRVIPGEEVQFELRLHQPEKVRQDCMDRLHGELAGLFKDVTYSKTMVEEFIPLNPDAPRTSGPLDMPF